MELKPPQFPKARGLVLRRLLGGFAVIIVLLALDGFVGFFGARQIRDGLSALTGQQLASQQRMESLQRVQGLLRQVDYQLLDESGNVRNQEDALLEAESTLRQMFQRVKSNDPDKAAWQELEAKARAVANELKRVLSRPKGNSLDLAGLLGSQQELSLAAEKLNRTSFERIEHARKQIEDASWHQSIEDRVLLAACLLVSSLFLVTSTRVYYRMNQQSEELNKVSWQLLERQELLAQRLSRELHDELGQSLTALKTNFSRHATASCVDPAWMQDCTDLLKGSIRSAHEISQLLRPTLLDDFGLDSALSWLCERFEERNGIQVRYQSDYHWRLNEQAETHVFRIAQEALTNIARHAEATMVDMMFSKQDGLVRLKVSDNGVGLKQRSSDSIPSFGLTGMRARARSLEGEMRIEGEPGKGVSIEVIFPVK